MHQVWAVDQRLMILNWTSLSDNIRSQAPHYAPAMDSSVMTSGNNELGVMHHHSLEHSSNLLCFRYIVSSEEQSEVHVNSLVKFPFWEELYFYIIKTFWLEWLWFRRLYRMPLIFHYYLSTTLNYEREGIDHSSVCESTWNITLCSRSTFQFRDYPCLLSCVAIFSPYW